MKRSIKISLHPLFLALSLVYCLIFISYGLISVKAIIINGYSFNNMIEIIICILCIALAFYLFIIRYHTIEVYDNKYILKSFKESREILFNEIINVKQTPVSFFNYRIGSLGVMGIISLESKGGETYNLSNLKNALKITFNNNDVLYISCDNPKTIIEK